MGNPPNWGFSNFKVFNLLNQKHEVFKISKYKRNINFDKMGSFPPEVGRQNSNFLTTDARHMNFLA